MRFEQFEDSMERDVGGGVVMISKQARLTQSGLVEAKIQTWNGNIISSDTVVIGRESERERYKQAVLKKVRAAKVKGVKSAEVATYLLDLDVALTDYFAAKSKASDHVKDGEEDNDSIPYRASSQGLHYLKPTAGGEVDVRLTNFIAELKGDTLEDDGQDTQHVFDIEGRLNGRSCSFSIPAAQFGSMRWAVEHLGAGAVIFPGCADHARCAIQLLSKNTVTRQVYVHTGWRKIDGEYVYLHAGGAIGKGGEVANVCVKLSADLSGFILPASPQGDDLKTAVRSSLRILDVAPRRITIPLLSITYRAPIGRCDFSVHFTGQSGAGKSELAALSQQHYGCVFDARNFPMNWITTANANEGIAYTLKDMVAVIDDFCPTGNTGDVQRMHKDADRLLRGQGNQSGRKRMRADATIKSDKYPRGLLLSTGEDVPKGKSLRARLLVLEVGPGDVDFDDPVTKAEGRLAQAQRDGAAGLLVSAMSGFIQWLAPRYENLRQELRDRLAKYRSDAARSGMHKRTPEIVANLALGWEFFLRFAFELKAITEDERDRLWREGWEIFGQAATMQSRYQLASDPVQVFLDLIQAAIASGRAHVAYTDGSAPADAKAWGWRECDEGNEWRPQGRCIGWVQGDNLYLEKDASFAEVQMIGAQTGEPLNITSITLHKRLQERDLLVSMDKAHETLYIRKTIGDMQQKVLHLRASLFVEAAPTGKKTDITDNGEVSDEKTEDSDDDSAI